MMNPAEGIPDPAHHRVCRRCRNWFPTSEGTLVSPELTGPWAAMRATRGAITGDETLLRFQCDRCTRVRRMTQRALWGTLFVIFVAVLLLERIGVLR